MFRSETCARFGLARQDRSSFPLQAERVVERQVAVVEQASCDRHLRLLCGWRHGQLTPLMNASR